MKRTLLLGGAFLCVIVAPSCKKDIDFSATPSKTEQKIEADNYITFASHADLLLLG